MTYDDWKLDNGEPAMVDREAEERQALIDAIEASDVVSEACKASWFDSDSDAIVATECDCKVTASVLIRLEIPVQSLGDFKSEVTDALFQIAEELVKIISGESK